MADATGSSTLARTGLVPDSELILITHAEMLALVRDLKTKQTTDYEARLPCFVEAGKEVLTDETCEYLKAWLKALLKDHWEDFCMFASFNLKWSSKKMAFAVSSMVELINLHAANEAASLLASEVVVANTPKGAGPSSSSATRGRTPAPEPPKTNVFAMEVGDTDASGKITFTASGPKVDYYEQKELEVSTFVSLEQHVSLERL
jgi:hypothetical protein